MFKIRKKFDTYKQKEGKTFHEPSMAIQSMRDGTFIESYLRKYQITGVLGDETRRSMAIYGDFADLADFQESANRVAQATQFFESLPSQLRKRFGNDVATFVAFASDPNNSKELVDLGILRRIDNEVSQSQDSTPQESPTPSPTVEESKKA